MGRLKVTKLIVSLTLIFSLTATTGVYDKENGDKNTKVNKTIVNNSTKPKGGTGYVDRVTDAQDYATLYLVNKSTSATVDIFCNNGYFIKDAYSGHTSLYIKDTDPNQEGEMTLGEVNCTIASQSNWKTKEAYHNGRSKQVYYKSVVIKGLGGQTSMNEKLSLSATLELLRKSGASITIEGVGVSTESQVRAQFNGAYEKSVNVSFNNNFSVSRKVSVLIDDIGKITGTMGDI